VGAYLLFVGRRPPAGEATPRASALGNRVTLLVFAQLAAGTLNLTLLAPVWLQLLHLLLADLLWITLVLLAAERLQVRGEAPGFADPSLASSQA
jgi:heme A synthase